MSIPQKHTLSNAYSNSAQPFTHAHHARTLQAALDYAQAGLYVVPLHTPIFDSTGACVGCSCEAYKRSTKYQAWLTDKGLANRFDPAFECRTPGKHPRISQWEDAATTDPAIIRAWFTRCPQLNLGIAPGKSGLVMFDHDAYKENYAGASLLTQADEQTATAISGNGGAHLYYQMPPGASYGNQTGDLPAGVDIRGHGGMVVVYPSIHPNGRPYQWEDGYSILECSPLPLPKALKTALDAAQATAPAKAIKFTVQATTERPDLSQWRISKDVRELIDTPPHRGQRSEADYKVTLSLCYAGATDDHILGVFEHFPIGTAGKFAERGRDYLARTIGKARSYVELHPRPDVAATVAQLRLWIRTTSFDPFISPAFKPDNGIYYTDATDTKVVDAVFDAMIADDRLEVTIGKKRLGKLAGVGCNTALRALTRLNGWLFTVTPDKFGAHVALVEECRFHYLDPSLSLVCVTTGDPNSENDNTINEYSPRKADEAFLCGTSRHVKQQVQAAARTMDITSAQAKEDYTFASFGESGLRVLDALIRAGDMTGRELVEETGKKPSAIGTACRRLREHGLIEATRPNAITAYTYSLADNVWERLDAIAPHLRSYKLQAQREDRRLVSAVQWSQKELTKAQEPAVKHRLNLRIEKLSAQRIPHLARLHEELPADEVKRLAYEVGTPYGPHPATQAKLERYHADARMDVAESQRAEQWQLTKTAEQLRSDGDGKKDAVHKLTLAGYIPNEAWTAVQQVWGSGRASV